MLLYKNHRFFYEGVSFAIPDGYCLDTNYGDGAEDSLDFWTADKSLRIRIAIEKETKGPRAELNYVIRELEECVVLEGPKAVMMNGLAGYQATYDTGSRQYCELRFSVSAICAGLKPSSFIRKILCTIGAAVWSMTSLFLSSSDLR